MPPGLWAYSDTISPRSAARSSPLRTLSRSLPAESSSPAAQRTRRSPLWNTSSISSIDGCVQASIPAEQSRATWRTSWFVAHSASALQCVRRTTASRSTRYSASVPAATRVSLTVLAIAIASAIAPAPARAQPSIERPLLLEPGRCEAQLVLESNESVRRRFEPISVAPDVHCGVAPRLTVGVTHSARALSLVDSGGGLCLRGEEAGCESVYDGTAVDSLVHLRGGAAAVAARARLVAASYSPFKPSLRVGALVRLRRGRAALLLDPHLALGLANRDRGNRDQLNVPVRGELLVGSRVMLAFGTGVRGELAVFRDAFAVPVATGVEVSPVPAWDFGLEVGFPRLLGPQNTFKERHVTLYVTYRPGPLYHPGGPPIAAAQADHASDSAQLYAPQGAKAGVRGHALLRCTWSSDVI